MRRQYFKSNFQVAKSYNTTVPIFYLIISSGSTDLIQLLNLIYKWGHQERCAKPLRVFKKNIHAVKGVFTA
jgi:hypothetical protein